MKTETVFNLAIIATGAAAIWWLMSRGSGALTAASTAVAEKAAELFPSQAEKQVNAMLSTPATFERPTLRYGSSGPTLVGYIVELQNRLGIPTDGIFGSRTLDAVISLQKRMNLDPDGIVGPATWRALITGVAVVTQSGTLTSGSNRSLIR